LTYFIAKKQIEQERRGKKEVKVYTTVEPVLVVSTYDTGQGRIVERKVVPLASGVVTVNGRPVLVEFKTKLTTSMYTMLDLSTTQRFLRGETEDLRQVYPKLRERIKGFVSFSWDPRLYDVVTCWAVATYFANVFTTFPQLFFIASYGTGKTRAGLTVCYASRRGFAVTDPTEASVFRIAEAVRATLFVDDIRRKAEHFLHMGYKRGLRVPRVEKVKGDRLILSLFETYQPLIVTDTELPKGVDLSRGILIQMRKDRDPHPEKRDPTPEDFAPLRSRLYLAELTQFHEVYETYRQLAREDLGLYGRDWEVWSPVLTIARIVGGDVWRNVLSYALENVEAKKEELYSEEKEILRGIEELLLEEFKRVLERKAEEVVKEIGRGDHTVLIRFFRQVLFPREDSKEKDPILAALVWAGGDSADLPIYMHAAQLLLEKIRKILDEEGVRFTAATLRKYMKAALVRSGDDEEDDRPYTERQFDRFWTPQKIGRRLAVMGIKTKRSRDKTRTRYKVVTLSLFRQLCQQYFYEPINEEITALVFPNLLSDMSEMSTHRTFSFENKKSRDVALSFAEENSIDMGTSLKVDITDSSDINIGKGRGLQEAGSDWDSRAVAALVILFSERDKATVTEVLEFCSKRGIGEERVKVALAFLESHGYVRVEGGEVVWLRRR
ncbi:MAG: hypothetical protein DRJ41_03770, partial [Thermoprotei archaeon]